MQAPRLEALSVLIVDDSKHMCELISAMLRAFGIAPTRRADADDDGAGEMKN